MLFRRRAQAGARAAGGGLCGRDGATGRRRNRLRTELLRARRSTIVRRPHLTLRYRAARGTRPARGARLERGTPSSRAAAARRRALRHTPAWRRLRSASAMTMLEHRFPRWVETIELQPTSSGAGSAPCGRPSSRWGPSSNLRPAFVFAEYAVGVFSREAFDTAGLGRLASTTRVSRPLRPISSRAWSPAEVLARALEQLDDTAAVAAGSVLSTEFAGLESLPSPSCADLARSPSANASSEPARPPSPPPLLRAVGRGDHLSRRQLGRSTRPQAGGCSSRALERGSMLPNEEIGHPVMGVRRRRRQATRSAGRDYDTRREAARNGAGDGRSPPLPPARSPPHASSPSG